MLCTTFNLGTVKTWGFKFCIFKRFLRDIRVFWRENSVLTFELVSLKSQLGKRARCRACVVLLLRGLRLRQQSAEQQQQMTRFLNSRQIRPRRIWRAARNPNPSESRQSIEIRFSNLENQSHQGSNYRSFPFSLKSIVAKSWKLKVNFCACEHSVFKVVKGRFLCTSRSKERLGLVCVCRLNLLLPIVPACQQIRKPEFISLRSRHFFFTAEA